MSTNLVPLSLKTGAEAHASAETDRKKQLFAWADGMLDALGLVERVSQAGSFEDLRKVVFDTDAVEVQLAIRDALHPAGGSKADHFIGMREGGLKRLLNARFSQLKKQREVELLRGHVAGAKLAGEPIRLCVAPRDLVGKRAASMCLQPPSCQGRLTLEISYFTIFRVGERLA
jgi:hypothetical protein